MKKNLLLIILIISCGSLLYAQPKAKKPADNRAQVAILGVYHFENPKLDYAKFEVADVMRPEGQKELAAVTKRLAKFRPTKIALEWHTERNEAVNADYQKYLAGQFELTRNEVHQIGFRLAKELGHKQVYLIDHGGSPGDTNLGAAMGYAQQKDPEAFKQINSVIGDFTQLFEKMQHEKTITETLRFMNTADASHKNHGLYIRMVEIGAGDGYVGADAVTAWYRRNLKIYANLAKISEPGDRILVVFGQGHKPILEQIAIDSEKVKIVDIKPYL